MEKCNYVLFPNGMSHKKENEKEELFIAEKLI